MLVNHTPGPWRVEKSEDGKTAMILGGNPGEQLWVVENYNLCDTKTGAKIEHAEEDLLLMASSPDLLEALEECQKALLDNLQKYAYKNEGIMLDAYQKAVTAIRKVKGDTVKDPLNDDDYDGNDEQIDALKDLVYEKSGEIAKLEEQLKRYQDLHDGLSDMIEGGRLRKEDIPDDYEWLVKSLAEASPAA